MDIKGQAYGIRTEHVTISVDLHVSYPLKSK